MKVLIFLPLLSLVSIGSGCFFNVKESTTETTPMTMTTSSTTTTSTTTPIPPVTRPASPTSSCTGAEPRGTTVLRTVTLNTPASPTATASVSQTATFTAATTEKVFCFTAIDRKTGSNISTFAKTAGDFGTNTVTITATSAVGQSIDADIIFFGTL